MHRRQGRTAVLRFPSAARAAPPLARLDVALDLNTAPLPTLHNACRRCCAQEATPPNARLRNVTFCSLGLDGHHHPWWLPALCFVSGGLRSLLALCTPTSCVSVGADPALGPRLHKVGSRALRQPTGVGAPSCQPSACWSDRRHAAAVNTQYKVAISASVSGSTLPSPQSLKPSACALVET